MSAIDRATVVRRLTGPGRASWVAAASAVAAFTLAFWAHGRVDPHYYYAAAARSMGSDWHAFLFGAYDPAGAVTVDKVPGALWLQALSVRLFGFHAWALLVPQALAAAATVAVLYSAVRHWAGNAAAAIAAVVLALTPVTVALARENIPDTFLVLFLVCAARAAFLAVTRGRRRHLVAVAVWIGAAFHVKMAQAYVVLPGVALAYGIAAPGGLAVRLRRLTATTALTVAVSALWPLLMALTPRADRPYVDGSQGDSVWQMLFRYNGLSRFGHGDHTASQVTSFLADFGGPPGPGRLFGAELGPQVAWLLPYALVMLVTGLVAARRAARTDPGRAGWVLWGGWLLAHAVVFSAAAGVHPYYTAALVPAVAALTGAGTVLAVRAWRRRGPGGRVLPAAVAASGAWAVVLGVGAGVPPWQSALAAGVTVAVCAGLAAASAGRGAMAVRRLGGAVVLTSVCGCLVLPSGAWAVTASGTPMRGLTGLNPVAARTVRLPAAAMAALHGLPPDVPMPPDAGNMNMTAPEPRLLAFLDRHHHGERYELAVPTANTAAPYVRAGRSVLPMGGFTGAAPTPTLAELASLTASGRLRYVMTGGFHGGMGGAVSLGRQRWVAAHCAPVEPALYRAPDGPSGPPGAPETLFDCAPSASGDRP